MPTYVYEVILKTGESGQIFEIEQKMSDPALKTHPTTGQPVRRVIIAANIATRYTSVQDKARVSDKNLKANGFTKYVKADNGKYEKVLGDGPSNIHQ